jgi:hypothetical protein
MTNQLIVIHEIQKPIYLSSKSINRLFWGNPSLEIQQSFWIEN